MQFQSYKELYCALSCPYGRMHNFSFPLLFPCQVGVQLKEDNKQCLFGSFIWTLRLAFEDTVTLEVFRNIAAKFLEALLSDEASMALLVHLCCKQVPQMVRNIDKYPRLAVQRRKSLGLENLKVIM